VVRSLDGLQSDGIQLALRADGHALAALDRNGMFGLWDVRQPALLKSWQLVAADGPFAVAATLSPEGRYLATGNRDGTIYLLCLARRMTP
jgi:hypothetical protein